MRIKLVANRRSTTNVLLVMNEVFISLAQGHGSRAPTVDRTHYTREFTCEISRIINPFTTVVISPARIELITLGFVSHYSTVGAVCLSRECLIAFRDFTFLFSFSSAIFEKAYVALNN